MPSVIPVIEESKCNGCGLCVTVCRCGALVISAGKVKTVHIEQCGWCTLCELVCPTGAISCPFEVIIENGRDE